MNISILSVLGLILQVQTSNTNQSGPSNRRYSPSCCLVILQKRPLPNYQLVYRVEIQVLTFSAKLITARHGRLPPGSYGCEQD